MHKLTFRNTPGSTSLAHDAMPTGCKGWLCFVYYLSIGDAANTFEGSCSVRFFFTVQSELILLCKLADKELSSTSGGVFIMKWSWALLTHSTTIPLGYTLMTFVRKVMDAGFWNLDRKITQLFFQKLKFHTLKCGSFLNLALSAFSTGNCTIFSSSSALSSEDSSSSSVSGSSCFFEFFVGVGAAALLLALLFTGAAQGRLPPLMMILLQILAL